MNTGSPYFISCFVLILHTRGYQFMCELFSECLSTISFLKFKVNVTLETINGIHFIF